MRNSLSIRYKSARLDKGDKIFHWSYETNNGDKLGKIIIRFEKVSNLKTKSFTLNITDMNLRIVFFSNIDNLLDDVCYGKYGKTFKEIGFKDVLITFVTDMIKKTNFVRNNFNIS